MTTDKTYTSPVDYLTRKGMELERLREVALMKYKRSPQNPVYLKDLTSLDNQCNDIWLMVKSESQRTLN